MFRPDLAESLNNMAVVLGDLGRPEDALAAIEEAVTIRRELAARWPDAHRHELEQSLEVVAWLEHGEDVSDASPRVITIRHNVADRHPLCRSADERSLIQPRVHVEANQPYSCRDSSAPTSRVLSAGDGPEEQALLLGEPGFFFTAPGYDGWRWCCYG